MPKNFYGSICLTDLLEAAKTGHDGFAKSEKNGKIYANISVWLNDQTDKYGNLLSIQVIPAKDSDEFKSFYIGNLKEGKEKAPALLNSSDLKALPDEDDLPF